ncbi:V-type ATP synthase subunit F [Candidatus Margulisiibacteriota bacterium]
MYKIKMIGPKYLVSPLAALGLEVLAADSEAEGRRALEAATGKKEPALIFLTERLAVALQAEIEKLNQRPDVNIVLIPDNRGSTGLAAAEIHHVVRNSIGAEVIIRK